MPRYNRKKHRPSGRRTRGLKLSSDEAVLSTYEKQLLALIIYLNISVNERRGSPLSAFLLHQIQGF